MIVALQEGITSIRCSGVSLTCNLCWVSDEHFDALNSFSSRQVQPLGLSWAPGGLLTRCISLGHLCKLELLGVSARVRCQLASCPVRQ